MSKISWTDIQSKRLKELNADPKTMSTLFDTNEQRNHSYQTLERKLVKLEKSRLNEFLTNQLQPKIYKLECRLTKILNQQGFSRVTNPTIISKTQLARMTIDRQHPLFDKVFWINARQCLRPMLAPNLYRVMYELARLGKKPIRFFEIGPCFRKESDTSQHNNEFTMLNLVEMGLPRENRHQRLMELGQLIADAAGLKDYAFEKKSSAVYGDTIDIVCGDDKLEIASGAMGPHPLDHAWRIIDTWVGLGFGLERMVMIAEGSESIGKWGKSLAYLDGIRLNF
ncbi:MAG TPA: pyrrolysine--tRNA(Pyl) ligase large subunit [Phycisphaerales bacterium]|nr:pyrrolysine--tRNA(Pyl) ligase large subunit [Phycisphaerales bacterium]